MDFLRPLFRGNRKNNTIDSRSPHIVFPKEKQSRQMINDENFVMIRWQKEIVKFSQFFLGGKVYVCVFCYSCGLVMLYAWLCVFSMDVCKRVREIDRQIDR